MSETPKPAEGRDTLIARLDEDAGEACERFESGGSHIAPEYYCATCGATRPQHTAREARAALVAQQQEQDEALKEAQILLDGMDALCVDLLGQKERPASEMHSRIAVLKLAEAQLREAEARIKTLTREIGLTRERLDELNQSDIPLYDFVPQLVEELYTQAESGQAALRKAEAQLRRVEIERDASNLHAQRAEARATRADEALARLRSKGENG